MIASEKALEILKGASKNLKTEILPLLQCLHMVSAEEVSAPIDVPSFDNSAMDGYAFRFSDYNEGEVLKITTEIQAGASEIQPLKKAEVARIFTGAPLPPDADTVVPQEDVLIEEGVLKFKKEIQINANIRKKGTQTIKGNVILKKNTLITPEYIGFLATFGIASLRVFSLPKIGIIVTGKELIPAGKPIKEHQIFESNSVFLSAALLQLGIQPIFTHWVDDDEDALLDMVQKQLEKVDVLIFTGGISVGDYDFVKPVLEKLGTKEQFYKVKQKPGKPLFYGKLNDKDLFALPGNPSAVVMCYHVYLKPFILEKMGLEVFGDQYFAFLLNDYTKKQGLTHFVKAFVKENQVEILGNQLSYQMDAYAKANAFAVLPDGQEYFPKGEKVKIIRF